ncbi:MAG: hypothetical protein VW520_07485, partial [Candidatus Puniceispirillum sp.]
ASAVDAPKQFVNLSIVALAENGDQQNRTARVNPVDNAIFAAIDPGKINRMFKSIATRAELDPKEISAHSTRIGAAQD